MIWIQLLASADQMLGKGLSKTDYSGLSLRLLSILLPQRMYISMVSLECTVELLVNQSCTCFMHRCYLRTAEQVICLLLMLLLTIGYWSQCHCESHKRFELTFAS